MRHLLDATRRTSCESGHFTSSRDASQEFAGPEATAATEVIRAVSVRVRPRIHGAARVAPRRGAGSRSAARTPEAAAPQGLTAFWACGRAPLRATARARRAPPTRRNPDLPDGR